MFRKLVSPPAAPPAGGSAADLVRLRPSELIALLELAWNKRMDVSSVPLGRPDHRSNLPGLDDRLVTPLATQLPPSFPATPPTPTTPSAASFVAFILKPPAGTTAATASVTGWLWDHLIYAYMIENTRIYEIFRRMLHEFLHGEKLGAPSDNTQIWLRNTEELFYRDGSPFFIPPVASYVRPDLRASRRNAYFRMFGMDLNHGNDDNSPYAYIKAEAANREFVPTFEEFLREVWVGIVNVTAISGPRPTDEGKIFDLTQKLKHMLTTRRVNGNLSREEFAFVSMMSWFHLTVESNNLPIIEDLRAQATSAEQRLFKIAERVGLPAHGLSKSYFDIATPISEVLTLIETDAINSAGATTAFFTPGPLKENMNTIITHWAAITGRDMKAGKVAVAA